MVPPRILVVDDDSDIAEVFATQLRVGLGADVAVARDAYLALDHLSYHRVDLVVLDVIMPGASGMDLLERLEARGVDIPVVLVTGLASPRIDERATELHAAAVVTKPPAPGELVETVRRALAHRPVGAANA
jgi:DNA-binding NtrC family response regulator